MGVKKALNPKILIHTSNYTFERMTLFVNAVSTISACGVISQMHENANLTKHNVRLYDKHTKNEAA
jgi:hypothetical protein